MTSTVARDRRSTGPFERMLVPGVLAMTAISSLIPILVDGWWLDLGLPGRYALAVACWLSVLAGLLARQRRPGNPIGIWLAVSGLLAPPAFLVGASSPALIVASAIAFVGAAGFGAMVPISFPAGRLDGRAPLAIAAVAVTCLIYRVQQVVLFDPVKSLAGWTQPNPFAIQADPSAVGVFEAAYGAFGIAFLVLFAVWLARRWARLTGPARLSISPVLTGALFFVACSLVQAFAQAAGVGGDAMAIIQFVHTLSFSAVPLGFMAGLLRVRMARSAIADLVVELGEAPEPGALRRALATALGDPSLEVSLWSKEQASFVDPDGSAIASLDAVAGGRAVTLLERDGEPLVAIIHDPALLDDPGLVASVAATVRLTVENDRLAQEVRAQLTEVRASRARIVEATDEERRRLERDIHDGAQQRLVALSYDLGRARSRLGADADPELARTLSEASEELRVALTELRELARGIHPAVLTQAGLGPAIRALAERSTVPTELRVELTRRLPAAVEATAYFVVSEALTNVGKHGGDCSAQITLAEVRDCLELEVRDDGPGGADPSSGSGLRGLRDRVEAIGGSLELDSRPGHGTSLKANLPIPEVVV
jgi:signal transduction histidine kinase